MVSAEDTTTTTTKRGYERGAEEVNDDMDNDIPGLQPPGACVGTAGPSNDEVLLLVDATNGFNNPSMYCMLWTVRYRCTKLSCFAFNCSQYEIHPVCR